MSALERGVRFNKMSAVKMELTVFVSLCRFDFVQVESSCKWLFSRSAERSEFLFESPRQCRRRAEGAQAGANLG